MRRQVSLEFTDGQLRAGVTMNYLEVVTERATRKQPSPCVLCRQPIRRGEMFSKQRTDPNAEFTYFHSPECPTGGSRG